ncbi:glutamate transport system permease protein [Tamaricihabitans halophyticus]|uniref:Glutamate transport system permease protein n=1 Tax=Tamaricihabitans halophyticus TaxID=1262583 RepID=A0A4R2QG73_9PSEU|nr:amino acid ABC transporter permease [Tamaricihabitans halophyticus]TCP47328.1 glutamate transport system permease protein [Tamaricihabitans halophyticus]
MDDLLKALPGLLEGLGVTLYLSIPAFLLAMVLGSMMAIFRVSRVRSLEVLGTLYVEGVRNSPLLLILLLLVFGLPDVGILLPLELAVIIGLGLYSGTFVCEAVRSGINGVDVGMVEAARASGLTTRHVISEVLLPVALRTMIPPLATVFITTVLSSALAAAVGVTELTGATRVYNLVAAQPFVAFGIAAAGYLLINLLIGWASAKSERLLRFNQ